MRCAEPTAGKGINTAAVQLDMDSPSTLPMPKHLHKTHSSVLVTGDGAIRELHSRGACRGPGEEAHIEGSAGCWHDMDGSQP